jgi:lysozyme
MPISNEGLNLIKYFEGSRLIVYKDTNGKATVGTGHLVQSKDNLQIGDAITQEQADAFLQADLINAENKVRRFVTIPLVQCELDSLISQAYNMTSFSVLAQRLQNEGRVVYLQKLLLYCHDAKGHELLGLKRRRYAEEYMFTGQSWSQILPQVEAMI